jgi:hypothetical protein
MTSKQREKTSIAKMKEKSKKKSSSTKNSK